MLSVLRIENIAVIEAADITFDDRLNAMTGETGAGKSIVIDALGALLGARASRELIRAGCDRALVSAVFCGVPASAGPVLRELGAEPQEELLVSRELFPDGRNVCKVAGRLVTVAQLRELGLYLAQIHGQHDAQSLLADERHIGFLDAFARTALTAYRAAYKEWTGITREIGALRMDEDEKARRADALQYRLDEIENAALIPGEEGALLERRNRLRHAQKITGALDAAYAALYGDEDRPGAIELLDGAAGALAGAERYSEGLGPAALRLREIGFQAEDVTEELRALRGEMDVLPGEAETVESRLELLHKLKSRFGAPPDELLEKAAEWRRELDGILFSGETLRKLEERLAGAGKRLTLEAETLTAARQKAAARMEKRLVAELAELDMAKVRFRVELGAAEPGPDGADTVRFLLSANPGEPLKPLSKTASGGELSRIMLAIKNTLSDGEEAVTLVFDEVDAGVSGRAAQRVAEKLRKVAAHRQVLCVTHLLQIAAMADTHFRVAKGVSGDRTITSVDRLGYEERVEELARITGGSRIAEATRGGAAELLTQAEAWKKEW
ncbi:MAG: DNA repair protein RecN [Oscillospiraceae bacterium]|nr:DNA repair protein RecN [Oscillospiraceae bacterium]